MAQTSWPFDAGPGAVVREAEWQKLSRAFLRTGVVTGQLSDLLVTSDGSGMSVSVASGQAQVEGFTFVNDAALATTIATANATNPRIDTVVARLDRAANSVVLAVVAGTPAVTPARPVLSATDALFEMPLADVRVDAAVGVIAAGKVTDRRTFARNLAAAQTGLRNRLHNGDFRVNQRGYVSGTALALNAFGFDRWKAMASGLTLTFTATPNGQVVTKSASPMGQVIERADMPAGRYVLSQVAGATAVARVYNVGSALPAFVLPPFVVDLDGLADVQVEISGTGTVGEVQLEQVAAAGTVADATPFERRPVGLELGLCQRFFRRFGGHAAAGRAALGTGMAVSATQVRIPLLLPVRMRAAPTGATDSANFQVRTGADSTFALSVAPALQIASTEAIEVLATIGTSSLTAGQLMMLESLGGGTGHYDVSADL